MTARQLLPPLRDGHMIDVVLQLREQVEEIARGRRLGRDSLLSAAADEIEQLREDLTVATNILGEIGGDTALEMFASRSTRAWKDIRTAPRDGTEFLACCGEHAPFTCHWNAETGAFVHVDPDDGFIFYRPTHWLSPLRDGRR